MELRLEPAEGLIHGTVHEIGDTMLRNFIKYVLLIPREKQKRQWESIDRLYPSHPNILLLAGFATSVEIDPASVTLDDDAVRFRTARHVA